MTAGWRVKVYDPRGVLVFLGEVDPEQGDTLTLTTALGGPSRLCCEVGSSALRSLKPQAEALTSEPDSI